MGKGKQGAFTDTAQPFSPAHLLPLLSGHFSLIVFGVNREMLFSV